MDPEAGTTPIGGSPANIDFLAPELHQQEPAAQETVAAPVVEEPAAESAAQEPATQEAAPLEPKEQIQYEKLTDKLKAGKIISNDDFLKLQELEARSVPYAAYTQQRQKDRAEVQQYQSQLKEYQDLKTRYDSAIPILQALSQSPQAQALLDAQLAASSVGQEAASSGYSDPAVMQKLTALEQTLQGMQDSQAQAKLDGFIEQHPEMKEDHFLRENWYKYGANAARAGVEDPLAIAYKIAKAEVEDMRKPSVDPARQAAHAAAAVAAIPSGQGNAPIPKPPMTEAEKLVQDMMSGRQPLQGIQFERSTF
jgi:hypothetical protein